MGGRGSSSGTYHQIVQFVFGKRTGKAKPIDITRFKNDSLQQTENRIRKLKNEQLYVFDANDRMLGGYQGGKESVSFPSDLKKLKNVTVTHSHPQGERGYGEFGGTFSFPDVINMVNSQWKEHRAVASGQGELNYIMRAKTGKNGQRIGKNKALLDRINKDAPKLDSEFNRIARETFLEFLKQGKSSRDAAHVARQKSVGLLNRYWKDTLPQYGY